LRRSKAFDDDITEAMLLCALRFDGYSYLEVVHPKLSKETNFSPLVETLSLHSDLNDNFAAFFALQRYLHKWGGARLTKYSREHVAYDHLFLMLYRQPVFKDFVNRDYDVRWEREFASRAEEIAAYVRNSFRRIGRGPIAI
jgi:hypothetical protein